jgi:hypothetical protein
MFEYYSLIASLDAVLSKTSIFALPNFGINNFREVFI